MFRLRAVRTLAGVCVAVTALLAAQLPAATAAPVTPSATSPAIYRVSAPDDAAAQRLMDAGFDVLEKRDGEDLFVVGSALTATRLRTAGFAPKSVETLTLPTRQPPTTTLGPGGVQPMARGIDDTYNGGYHTLTAHLAHANHLSVAMSNLVKVVKYGESHRKATPGGLAGHDLTALCITRRDTANQCALSPQNARPRFLFIAQIHAREVLTGDIAWRFIDYLTTNYGRDLAISNLLNTSEVWVVPIANPDGVDFVEQGINPMHRKNADFMELTDCEDKPQDGSYHPGVDLNRNAFWDWGGAHSSNDVCSPEYRGPTSDSEVEITALQDLIKDLFPDQRGPRLTDAAPATAKGTFLTLHSYSGYVMFPWNYANTPAPNDAGMRAIARTLADKLKYKYGRPGEIPLYNASGTIDDWAYGHLGVASFTIELDSCNSFQPVYSRCADDEWSDLRPALMYLAEKAKAPYAS